MKFAEMWCLLTHWHSHNRCPYCLPDLGPSGGLYCINYKDYKKEDYEKVTQKNDV